ncbi:hypothetical protein ACFUMH_10760 [Cellulomonas sp. NPDC057328]|uniref:hypothetical protein n=1 Tax=Cellulomonas sp. NPDC057328 TaxID=3346101 RepID=UPI0036406936
MPEVDRIAEPWGTRTPYAEGTPWPRRVDMHLAEGVAPEDVDRRVQTARSATGPTTRTWPTPTPR